MDRGCCGVGESIIGRPPDRRSKRPTGAHVNNQIPHLTIDRAYQGSEGRDEGDWRLVGINIGRIHDRLPLSWVVKAGRAQQVD
jgi:hypothetical protein